jgi:hypothetical protein
MGPAGTPGVNGTVGAPGTWIKSFAYAAYIPESVDCFSIIALSPLTFNYIDSQNILYTNSRLTIQNDGVYQVSASINNVFAGVISDVVFLYIWKNGLSLNGAYMLVLPSYPLGVSGSAIVRANAGDYFELTATASSLFGTANVAAYSIELLQLS